MKYRVYSVRDRLVGFGALTLDSSDESAKRNFAYSLSNGLNEFACDDFDLYWLGIYDLENGILDPNPVPQFVISGHDAHAMYGG